MKTIFTLAAFLFILLFEHNADSADFSSKVNSNEAQHLVLLANPDATDESLYFDKRTEAEAQLFFIFDGLSICHGCNGSYGFFAVNKWTGDVWALWGCYKQRTRALQKAQVAIKRRFSPSELHDYQRLSRLKPECTFDRNDG